jgi:hypothetical protein
MAIAPNTNPFVSGAVLTAAQMTALPMGIYSFVEKTTTTTSVTAEAVILTLPSFTAVANRYYRVTAFFPYIETTGGGAAFIESKIRKGTTTGGTQLQTSVLYVTATSAHDTSMTITWVGTLTAGAQQLVVSIQSSATVNVLGNAVYPMQMTIEDIGGA